MKRAPNVKIPSAATAGDPLFVADSGLYSAETVARLNAGGVRWMFQRFEGISPVGLHPPHAPPSWRIAGLEPLHEQVIALLGPFCAPFFTPLL